MEKSGLNFEKYNTPAKIQNFLNSLPFNYEEKGETIMSPARVWEEKKAHCLEGALFAAAALWSHGEKPLLLDLKTTRDDLEHVVALFKRNGRWGAISKTNHVVLRYREPVYKTIRELATSYFHEYFLDSGKKTMRSFSKPFDLRKLGKEWIYSENNLWHISEALDGSPHEAVFPKGAEKSFRRADHIEIQAGRLMEWKKNGNVSRIKAHRHI